MSRLTAAAIVATTFLGLVALSPASTAAARAGKSPHAAAPAALVGCGGTIGSCMHVMVGLLNADRSLRHLAPLRLSESQSFGSASCAGSIGHSVAMARTNDIWHVNNQFPRASFPNNICVGIGYMGQNVGRSSSGKVLQDLQTLNRMMMSEPRSWKFCSRTIDHACNILGAAYTSVGIGIYVDANATTWLTEDFTG